MMSMPLFFFDLISLNGAIIVLFITLVVYLATLKSSRHHLPPGPKPVPFFGNAFQVPVDHPENGYAEWGQEFGDIIYLRIFNQPLIVLDSLKAARDLVDKRSSIYSDRPRFVLLSELMGWHSASTHTRYGPRFRKHRRFINQVFNTNAISVLRPLQEKQTLILLNGLLNSPGSFVKHFRRFAAGTVLKITYGYEINSVDDLLVRVAERAGTLTVESGSPAATMVDFFPILRYIPSWVPFISFKRNAQEAKKAVEEMMNVPFERVRSDMLSGTAPPSYTSRLIESHLRPEDGSMDPEDEEDIKGSAGTLFAAAEDTTVATISTFILAMTLYPHVQRKMQEELDRVIGNDRLPTLEDRPSLPYLECVLKELVRWNPPVPLGLPHRLMQDDVYQTYFIPADAMVLINIKSILHKCPEPTLFRPERYIEDPSLPDPCSIIFGFGRRICPGRHFAETSLWTTMANITAAFNILKVGDVKEGREAKPEFTNGFVRHPKPFKCSITPRNPEISMLVNQASKYSD